jgi:hypothetical protein
MATVLTTTYNGDTAITFDISSLGTSSTFVAGRNSTEIDNTSNKFVDCIVDVEGITGHASTAPTVGQVIQLFIVGNDTSFATKTIGGVIDGSDGAATLPHVSVLQSLRLVGQAAVTVATAGLVYYIQPFSVAAQFGGVMPKFWCLYLAHNHTGALAASQSTLFSYNGITFTAT